MTRELHDRLRRIVLISKASLGANYSSVEKLLTTVLSAIDANPNRGQADEVRLFLLGVVDICFFFCDT